MMTMFNYNRKDADFNEIIDECLALFNENIEGQSADYKERNKILNAAIAKYAVSGTRFESMFEEKGVEIFKDPRVTKNAEVRDNYNVVVSEYINSALPSVTSKLYNQFFAEIRQVGWGETAKFEVTSNELYQVNEVAEGVNRGVLQPIYNNEFTVNCKVTEVAAGIDWYPVAAGVFDWGDFGRRYTMSFQSYIQLKIMKALTAATNQIGAAYQAAGVDTTNWTNIVDRVSAANGGMPVVALGTLAALNKVIPSTVGLQYGLGSEIVKEGKLDRYLATELIAIDQAMVPGTVNTTAQLLLPTNKIYFIARGAYKPVKVVFEGTSSVVEAIPDECTDRQYKIRIQEHVGVDAVVGSKFGTITLA